MGFCRRCGDIVIGIRCKCGGASVAPSIAFNNSPTKKQEPDRWSRAYIPDQEARPSVDSPWKRASSTEQLSRVPKNYTGTGSSSRETPVSRNTPSLNQPKESPVSKIPSYRSTSSFQDSHLESRVTSHIQSSTMQKQSTPARKEAIKHDEGTPQSPCDIFKDPLTSTLSKAYGSVLQPKETLNAFTCVICSDPFPPDATIYPDPSDPDTTTRFLCKPCFAVNGGSKGDCASCKRPVLTIATEGGFVENAGKVWHRRCFRCDGCFKDVGDSPMVDLLGRPTCEDCFTTCLKRPTKDSPSPRRFVGTPEKKEKRGNPGGMQGTSREGSPAMDELHLRLGLAKSRESSPFVERQEITSYSSRPAERSPERYSSPVVSDGSPRGRYERFRASQLHSSKVANASPSRDVGSDSERRSLRKSHTMSSIFRSESPTTTSSSSYDSFSCVSSTPDLTDFSDGTTISSGPSTPPSSSPSIHDMFTHITPTKALTPTNRSAKATPTQLTLSSPSTPCAKCTKPLFRAHTDGKFVTVPEESAKCLPPKSYHVDCFRCAVCDDPFEATKNGQAMFIRSSSGCCHVGCATPERIIIKPLAPLKSSTAKIYEPPLKTAPAIVTSFPRFGSGTFCPGCQTSVGAMERGVVPGPQGSRWHSACLVCGGKAATARRGQRNPDEPGCAKKLDSAAKTDGEGGVWCRECRLMLADSPSSPARPSPSRPITPSHTGGIFSRFPPRKPLDGLVPQATGTTTIARQFTGMGGLSSQLTGSGINPTRQLHTRSPSPVKMMASGRFPRPKSVIGVRGKSVDEGRGMFLVRQMTGGGQNFGL